MITQPLTLASFRSLFFACFISQELHYLCICLFDYCCLICKLHQSKKLIFLPTHISHVPRTASSIGSFSGINTLLTSSSISSFSSSLSNSRPMYLTSNSISVPRNLILVLKHYVQRELVIFHVQPLFQSSTSTFFLLSISLSI